MECQTIGDLYQEGVPLNLQQANSAFNEKVELSIICLHCAHLTLGLSCTEGGNLETLYQTTICPHRKKAEPISKYCPNFTLTSS